MSCDRAAECCGGSLSGRALERIGELIRSIQHRTQIHQRSRRTCRAFPVGIADRIAVQAKYSMVQRNHRFFEERFHFDFHSNFIELPTARKRKTKKSCVISTKVAEQELSAFERAGPRGADNRTREAQVAQRRSVLMPSAGSSQGAEFGVFVSQRTRQYSTASQRRSDTPFFCGN